MQKLIVPAKYHNKKLVSFLLDSFDALSLNLLYKTIRKKDIKINSKRILENVNIKQNDIIEIYLPDELLFKNNDVSLNIIYEDENILLLNKPSKIEVVGSRSLTENVQKYYNSKYIKPCHRLDRNTTGIILFAKNEISLSILLDKFKNHEIEKHYICTVYGIPDKCMQTITSYLFKDNKKSTVYISDFPKKGYQKIITSYKVQSFNLKNNTSILDVTLHTGKTHQIRAHLAHIGYPIVGDGKYGINSINKKFGFKYQQLCSYSIKFLFKTDSGILNYLNNKEFSISNNN